MERPEIITTLYQQLKATITHKLNEQGYETVHEQHDDIVFDSRYIIWSNNEEALRLTWDGKEGWFILEVTSILPLSAHTVWNEIKIVPLNEGGFNVHYSESLVEEMLNSLN